MLSLEGNANFLHSVWSSMISGSEWRSLSLPVALLATERLTGP